jgi:DNA-binding NarL/FixJ family response regulator
LPARILIVDDHAVIRTTIRSILLPHLHFFQVCEEAWNGKEAVEQVQKLKPEIVLLDINMPVMDGVKAAEEAGPGDDSLGRVSPRTGETARLILSVRIFSREYEGSHGSIFLWRAQRIRSRDI